MARRLDVFLGGRMVGRLEQDDSGQLHFQYDESWLRDPSRMPLSQSLPLRTAPYGNRETRPFFGGLLPEAEKRELVARILGVSERNDFALLDGIGGECAGAITLLHTGESPAREPGAGDYRSLDDEDVARILDTLRERPLLVGEDGVRLSLAGAQDKLPVLVVGESLALPLHGAPSSHILKPSIPRLEDTVYNEWFCLALAKAIDLHAVDAEIRSAQGKDYLLVERYDRRRDRDGSVRRLHQEDLCQALGIAPERKYQAEGGPSLQQCFDIVRRTTARPVIELARLLDAVLFNVLVGNNDAHGKNYSLLYANGGIELAPVYDVASTAVYPDLSRRFAMKIGGKSEIGDLFPRHWERFAKDAGLAAPPVRRRLLDLARRLPERARALQSQIFAPGRSRAIVQRIVRTIEERGAQVIRRYDGDAQR